MDVYKNCQGDLQMKKMIYLLFILPFLLLASCGDGDNCNQNNVFYNYGGKEVSLSLTLENQLEEDLSISLGSYVYAKEYDDFSKVDFKLPEEVSLASGKSQTLTVQVMNNGILYSAAINSFPHKLFYQSIVGSVKYSDGSQKKFTGYDFDQVTISSLKKEDFDLTGFGYYLVDTSVEPSDKTFGLYYSNEESVNGTKDGVIPLKIPVTSSGLTAESK